MDPILQMPILLMIYISKSDVSGKKKCHYDLCILKLYSFIILTCPSKKSKLVGESQK